MALPKRLFDEIVVRLTESFKNKEDQLREHLDEVTEGLEDLRSRRGTPLHSVSSRIKELGSLRGKLDRKFKNSKKPFPSNELRAALANNGQLLNPDLEQDLQHEFFHRFTDLAGARALVVFEDQIPLVDFWILNYLVSENLTVGEVEVHYTTSLKVSATELDDTDANRATELDDTGHNFAKAESPLFRDLSFESRDHRLIPKSHTNGYTSVHYALDAASGNPNDPLTRCELQVRTIYQEGWSELSHRLTYPDSSAVDHSVKTLLARLAHLLILAESIATDIREHALQPPLEKLLQPPTRAGLLDRDATLNRLMELIGSAPHHAVSAPLATVGLLRGLKSETLATRLVSLDLSQGLDGWLAGESDSESKVHAKAYFAAHQEWVGNGHGLAKYVVLPGSEGAAPARQKIRDRVPDALRQFFYLISDSMFRSFQAALRQGRVLKVVGTERVQFLVWDPDHQTTFSCDSLTNGVSARGFYSPSPTGGLASPIVWMDESDWITDELLKYARLLEGLRGDGLATPLTSEGLPPEIDDQGAATFVKVIEGALGAGS